MIQKLLLLLCFLSTSSLLQAQGNKSAAKAANISYENNDKMWENLSYVMKSPGGWKGYTCIAIGNGLFGARVKGSVSKDEYYLSNMSFWSGGVFDNYDKTGKRKAALALTRKHLAEGKFQEAEESARALGAGMEAADPHPLGEIIVQFPWANTQGYTDYQRVLDLDKATAVTEYKIGHTTYTREAFCSNPDQVMAFKYSTDDKTKISFTLSMNYQKQMK
ncbi:MAG: glycoside hydrolase N-terminal domain-containing protein, partial [Lentisphaeraceae bacterium]|nr:glycoside hydrolase N-terminal domain-containing protein [Lentisphaeraceae bacterium]